MNLIVYSIPIFFALIAIELVADYFTKKKLYRLNDALTNINCGIGQQVIGLFAKLFTVAAYIYVYDKFRLFEVSNEWYVYLICFVGVDFLYYWFHRLSHEINAFWAAHVVHHQSEEYNLSVALRQSWFQGMFQWAFYIPLAFIGFDPYIFATLNALNTLYQFWIHTRLIKKLPYPIELIFSTPSHHRVHHGANPKYIDKNHGGTLIIWDRMFGSFQEEEEEVIYGTTKPVNTWNSLWVNFEYWTQLIDIAKRCTKWTDKVKLFFARPGWMPDELGGMQYPKEIDKMKYKKYDRHASLKLDLYALFQFIVILIYTAYFLFTVNELGDLHKVVSTIFILFSILNIGGILEKQKWVRLTEFIRIFSSFIIVGFHFNFDILEVPYAIYIIWFSLFLVSISWFLSGQKHFSSSALTV